MVRSVFNMGTINFLLSYKYRTFNKFNVIHHVCARVTNI